jgi:hypothetical protein
MKKLLGLFFVITCFTINGVSAQGFDGNPQPQNHQKKGQGKEKIRALYIAYITQSIDLSSNEAERFWPVHNQFDKAMRAYQFNDDNEIEKEEYALQIKKKYKQKFAAIIGFERTNRFFKKDREFRDKLIEKLRDKRLNNKRRNEN